MASEFQVQGLDGVLKRMRALPEKLQKKGALASLRKGARIVVKDARANALALDDPETASKIAKNVTSRADARGGKRNGGAMVKVGIAGGAKPLAGNTDTGHWRLLEFGTSKMPAQPFMRRALETNIPQVTDAIVTELKIQIDKLTPK
jgi:HK97 gp10 family phage protein